MFLCDIARGKRLSLEQPQTHRARTRLIVLRQTGRQISGIALE